MNYRPPGWASISMQTYFCRKGKMKNYQLMIALFVIFNCIKMFNFRLKTYDTHLLFEWFISQKNNCRNLWAYRILCNPALHYYHMYFKATTVFQFSAGFLLLNNLHFVSLGWTVSVSIWKCIYALCSTGSSFHCVLNLVRRKEWFSH